MPRRTKREQMRQLGESVTPGSADAKHLGCRCRGKNRIDSACPLHRDVYRIETYPSQTDTGDGS